MTVKKKRLLFLLKFCFIKKKVFYQANICLVRKKLQTHKK